MSFAPAQSKTIEQIIEAFAIHLASIERYRERDILHHIEYGNKIVELIDESHLSAAKDRKRLIVAFIHVYAVHPYRSRSRAINATDQVQQGRFA